MRIGLEFRVSKEWTEDFKLGEGEIESRVRETFSKSVSKILPLEKVNEGDELKYRMEVVIITKKDFYEVMRSDNPKALLLKQLEEK